MDEQRCCDPAYPVLATGIDRPGLDVNALAPSSVDLDPRDPVALLRWAMEYAATLRFPLPPGVDGPDDLRFRAAFGRDPLIACAELQGIDLEAARAALAGPAGEDAAARWRQVLSDWHASAPTGWEMDDRLEAARRHFDAARTADARVAVLARLRDRAPTWWRALTTDWPHHAPQTALLAAGLALYRHPQALLDQVVARHLDHAYGAVLGFARRPPVPERAHVVAQLSRQTMRHAVPAGTRFTGHDAAGEPAIFAAVRDTELTRAAVADVRALTVHRSRDALAVSAAPLAIPRPPAPGWPGADAGAPMAEIGFALASPVLALSGGHRRVIVTIALDGTAPVEGARAPFEVHYTTADGWHPVDGAGVATVVGDEAIIIELDLGPNAPPCAPPTGVARADFAEAVPAMKFTRRGPLPEALFRARVVGVEVSVEVRGLTPSRVESDRGQIDSTGEFAVFGSTPRPGARLRIDHPELWGRALDRVEVTCRRVGSLDLDAIYAGYAEPERTSPPDRCTVRLEHGLARDDTWTTIANQDWAATEGEPYLTVTEMVDIAPARPSTRPGRSALRWVLVDDLLHDDWPALVTRKALQHAEDLQDRALATLEAALAPSPDAPQDEPPAEPLDAAGAADRGPGPMLDRADVIGDQTRDVGVGVARRGAASGLPDLGPPPGPSGRPNIELGDPVAGVVDGRALAQHLAEARRTREAEPPALPGPPFVPRAAELTIGYRARATVFGASTAAGGLFHVEPFGVRRCTPGHAGLLPAFDALDAALYIGLSDPEPLSAPTVLVQVLEGSEDPAADGFVGRWHALTSTGWAPVEPVVDTTEGLRRAGVVRLPLPESLAIGTQRMPADLGWVRFGIEPFADRAAPDARRGVGAVLDVRAQALTVARVDTRFDTTTPAFGITRLARGRAAIKAIEQPYAAFGGQPAEDDATWRARVAERLGHKGRAINPGDYERLVLRQFPSIYRVRCLVHSRVEGRVRRHAPGHVTLALVGRLPDRFAADPLAPRVSSATRRAIRQFIEQRAPIGTRIHVVDACYVPIAVRADVSFEPGEAGGGRDRVQTALIEALAPWIAESASGPRFGGEVHISELIATIDAVPGVIDVRRLTLTMPPDTTGLTGYRPTEPHMVITSAAVHDLSIVEAGR